MQAVLTKYKQECPQQAALLEKLPPLVDKKLWNEFTNNVLQFVFNPQVRHKIKFDFYDNFIKGVQNSLDQIKLMKIVYVVAENMGDQQGYDFLVDVETKAYLPEQPKLICRSLQGTKLVNLDIEKSTTLLESLKNELHGKSNFNNFVYFSFYRFSYLYYRKKGEFKEFYSNTLQSLAYSTPEEVFEKQKNQLSLEMALSVLASPDMYNFSELIEQPLLKSLSDTPNKWAYDALSLFSKGNIQEYNSLMSSAGAGNQLLTDNKSILDVKIRLMAFLQLLFHLPKNERVVSFKKIAQTCHVNIDQVQTMLMKAMALQLLKGQINQIRQEVTISWIVPRVLSEDSVKVMRDKFQKWNDDLKELIRTVKDPSWLSDD